MTNIHSRKDVSESRLIHCNHCWIRWVLSATTDKILHATRNEWMKNAACGFFCCHLPHKKIHNKCMWSARSTISSVHKPQNRTILLINFVRNHIANMFCGRCIMCVVVVWKCVRFETVRCANTQYRNTCKILERPTSAQWNKQIPDLTFYST